MFFSNHLHTFSPNLATISGCYGSEIHTPNLDKLAQKGVRFNHFYNASRSCPTRASLLTGLYQHQAGIGRMTFDAHLPGYRGTLSRNAVTIAEVLKGAGYTTSMVGKWHVAETPLLQNDQQPSRRSVIVII